MAFDANRAVPAKICIGRVVGALLGAGSGYLFHPCLRAFSPSGAQSPSPCSPSAALPRPNALTLDPLCAAGDFRRFPSGRVAASRTQPTLFIAARAIPLQRFPSALVRSATLRAHHANNPATHARRAPNIRRSDVAGAGLFTRFLKKRILKTEINKC